MAIIQFNKVDDIFFAWVSPDGEVQFALMAYDLIMLMAITDTFSKTRLCKSQEQMIADGFTIRRIRVKATEFNSQEN